jgi:hypothetical protein
VSRRLGAAALLCLTLAFALPQAAQAAFGFEPGGEGFSAFAEKQNATAAEEAGMHPYALQAHVGLNAAGGESDGDLRDLAISLPPGLLINPTKVSECPEAAFATPRTSPYEASASGESCPNSSQVGTVAVNVGGTVRHFGLFALVPPFGSVAALGASPFGVPLVFDVRLREGDSGLDLVMRELSQGLDLQGFDLSLWGTPWEGTGPAAAGEPIPSSGHNPKRGNCLNEVSGGSNGNCLALGASAAPEALIKSYLTLPTTPCGAPLTFNASASSWQGASASAQASIAPLIKCNKDLTKVKVQLMSDNAAARTGMAFNLDVNDGGGILNPKGIARPAIETAIASLPAGLSINPSLGAGLGVCDQAQFNAETATSEPGAGCPNNSKIGTVTAEGVLGLDEALQGSLYLARPYQNPFHSLLALYMTARLPRRGLIVKSVGQLEPDPQTGRLVATFDQLPRLLYTHFSLTLREGQRSTLISPPACGAYPAQLQLASWAQPAVFRSEASTFLINHGEGGGPCPAGGLAPFSPGLLSGSISPTAKSYTPFYLRMTRTDADQEITSYSATFPEGLLGKIAGVPSCPESAIAAAKGRTGIAERDAPSCPAASQIGRTEAGFGVGGVLAWAPGRLYLAGPYHGAPLSVVAVDSALVGPFDLGVVIVRSAIRVDPRSAQVAIDSAGSDPIPNILKGIPLHLRDIRVFVDRPGVMENPTSCDPERVLSRLTGSGADLFSPADDPPATASERYQVLSCSALGFKPKLSFKLKGGTQRGQFPSLRATYTPRQRDANLRSVAVSLPHSLFLEQRHIGTVCTRPQFRAHSCPPRSVYGAATAITPLLDEPMSGPVYLRASDHTLPDIVAQIQGRGVEIEVVGRISKGREGIRASFEGLPDGPVTKFTMTMNGAKHGILVNSANACEGDARAEARFIGQNSETEVQRAPVRAKCKAKAKAKGKGR